MLLMNDKDVKALLDMNIFPTDYAYLMSLADEDILARVGFKKSIGAEIKALCKELNKEKLLPKQYKHLVTKWNGYEGIQQEEVIY